VPRPGAVSGGFLYPAGVDPGMEAELVLAPVDGSDNAAAAFDYAVAVAERYDARVHALFVLGEELGRRMRDGDIADETVAETTTAAMGPIRDRLDATEVPSTHSSAYGYSTDRLTQHPGSVIVEVADQLGADFVVLPRAPVTGDPEAAIEKAAQYVIAHADQPVLSV
jgi:nucleotide-binding universal stress UspA family protein